MDNCDEHIGQLSFFSDDFDPDAVLAAPLTEIERQLPNGRDVACFRKAQPLDNVAACAIVERAPYRPLIRKPRAPTAAIRLQSTTVGIPGVSGRRRSVSDDAQRIRARNETSVGVLRQMQVRFGANGGPLGFLLTCFERHMRVTIVLRRTHRPRGFLVGELAAFDKHLNVVLKHATLHDNGEMPRNIGQVFVRGDNVVAICR